MKDVHEDDWTDVDLLHDPREDDPLGPAKGIFNGLIISMFLYGGVALWWFL